MTPRANGRRHEHCGHIACPPFGIGVEGQAQPAAIGQLSVCCRCGRGMVRYVGVEDGGTHGPYVTFIARPAVPSLLIPPKAGRLI